MSYFPSFVPRYGSFVDLTDQTGSTSVPTAVKFGTDLIADKGITVVTDGSALTRITFAVAGVYSIGGNLQMANSDTNDHNVTAWVRLNGTDVSATAFREVVPKAAEGGVGFLYASTLLPVAAGDYIQIMWLVDNVALTLSHDAAVVGPPAYPARPSARIFANRVSS